MTGVDRQMWICGNCGETNDGEPGVCSTCGRPSRSTDPTRWDALPQRLARPQRPPESRETLKNRESAERRDRWEPRNAPGFRNGPPQAPRNAPPAVAGEPWPGTKRPGARMIPEPADPPPDVEEPDSRRRLLPAVPIVVLIAALAAAAILGGPRLLDSTSSEAETGNRAVDQGLGKAAPRSEVPIIPATAVPPLENATTDPARLVTVDSEVTHEQADEVAAMLESYFTGINTKDYAKVAEVLAPDGELDPDDPEQMARFSDGTATAKDSDVVLHDLTDLGGGRLGADVTFRSRQEAGDGPEGRPGETCTEWRVSYTITKFRIFQAEGTSSPC
ncbi:hypothetical protein ACTI_34590 [Actinoplanes sp. OR16]|uniref:hypothetical protein n=1 Tax=Actinoplanes sp. OR16 TaxID=946334 RepID=UPI000F6F05EC|nr:hypothetical protein [Actinoplanes sp. OR16]BBH66774.1 hypothetical protein ACTI_34590 [Actinoplanes sp. OR16]